MYGFSFLFKSIGLGIGLAMDAFTVSLANGLSEPKMRLGKMCGIAGIFAFFQAAMPMIGWLCIHTIAETFSAFQALVPWIALLLLCFIGGKMLIEGIKEVREDPTQSSETTARKVGFASLIVQGIATSIDALSVGFTICKYDAFSALYSALIIALITFIICLVGVKLGTVFGTKLAGKATVFGGALLVCIGIYIFADSMFLS